MSHSTLPQQGDAPNNRREIFGWAMYDWANSAFSVTVISVFLGPYLTSIAKAAADPNGLIYFIGVPIKFDSLFVYATSASVLLQVFFLPLLGALADYSHLRKTLLQLFCAVGAGATAGLIFLSDGWHWLGAALFIVANLSFGASVVFYNAYLPDIASPSERDRVSSFGWGLGYLGGALLLLLNLVFFTFRDALGVETSWAVRICLLSAGVWWFGFAQVSFVRLRSRYAVRALPAGETALSVSFNQLKTTFRDLRRSPDTLKYLVAYLLYNDGVQTVIATASVFGSEEMKMDSSELILVILMVQVVAFVGSFLFGWLAERFGTKSSIALSLVVWSAIVIYAWSFLQTTAQFWAMAAAVALVLGGTQALSRSLFSQMIPKGREAEYFSLYEISDRGTSWIGPLLFGLANQLFGGLRYGLLSLAVLFVSGLALLLAVNVEQATRDALSAAEELS